MNYLGLSIFISVVLLIDYHIYVRSGNALFFKDDSELEKNMRKVQHLKVENELKQLKKLREQEIKEDDE